MDAINGRMFYGATGITYGCYGIRTSFDELFGEMGSALRQDRTDPAIGRFISLSLVTSYRHFRWTVNGPWVSLAAIVKLYTASENADINAFNG